MLFSPTITSFPTEVKRIIKRVQDAAHELIERDYDSSYNKKTFPTIFALHRSLDKKQISFLKELNKLKGTGEFFQKHQLKFIDALFNQAKNLKTAFKVWNRKYTDVRGAYDREDPDYSINKEGLAHTLYLFFSHASAKLEASFTWLRFFLEDHLVPRDKASVLKDFDRELAKLDSI